MNKNLLISLLLTVAPFVKCYGYNGNIILRAENLEIKNSNILWCDNTGKQCLQLSSATGVSLGEKPSLGEDSKSVFFSGAQILPFRSENLLPVVVDSLTVSLAISPQSSNDDDDQMIIRHGNWDLRYSPGQKLLKFTIWHDDKLFSQITAPLELGIWQMVKASFTDRIITLQVNDVYQSKEAKDSFGVHLSRAPIFVGASSDMRGKGMKLRPLTAEIADIHISGQ